MAKSGSNVRYYLRMRELPFPYVTVTDQFGQARNIGSVGDAAVWLVAHWPIRSGDKLQAAKQACLDALAGKVTCTACRNAFIEAAKEAGNYVDEPQRLPPAGKMKKWHKVKAPRGT